MISLTTAPYYTVSAKLLCQPALGSSFSRPNLRLNIVVDVEPNEANALFQLVEKLEVPFLFTIKIEIFSNADNFDSLLGICYLLASFPMYASGDKILLPCITDGSIPEKSHNQIKTYFLEQDMEAPIVVHFGKDKSFGQEPGNTQLFQIYQPFNGNSDVAEWQDLALVNFETKIVDTKTFLAAVVQAEKEITINPSSGKVVSASYHNSEIYNWRKRAMLYRDFLGISKSVQEKEYYEVIDWYRREYEQLPLWYKRFGHIIKVVMGKRSFRSLYDDKVKKYRD